MSDPKQLHRVTWSNDVATFHCDGNRDSACHVYPDCECEVWSAEHDEKHPPVPHDECWLLIWLNAVGAEDTWYDGGAVMHSMPEVDGFIETEWDGDSVLWCYANSDELALSVVSDA